MPKTTFAKSAVAENTEFLKSAGMPKTTFVKSAVAENTKNVKMPGAKTLIYQGF